MVLVLTLGYILYVYIHTYFNGGVGSTVHAITYLAAVEFLDNRLFESGHFVHSLEVKFY